MYDNTSRVIEVNIDEILPNRFQPRIQFDEEEILELSDSIKEHGVIQPIVVRTIGDKYEIIAGERRYKASVLAGKETVPVIVKNLNDKDSAEIALIENVQRKNLTPIEEALSYKKILDMGYMTQEGLALKLGKSQSSIANKIRLLNLSDDVQEALLENKISERHARSLLKLETSKLQNEMLDRIIKERLTVRKTDEEIDKLKDVKLIPQEEYKEKTVQIRDIKEGENYMNNNNYESQFNNQNSTQAFNMFSTPMQTFEQPQTNGVNQYSMQQNNVQEAMPSFPTFDIFEEPKVSSLEEPASQVQPPMPEVQQPVTPEPAFSTYNPFAFENMQSPVVNNQPTTEQIEQPSTETTQPIYNPFMVANNFASQPVEPETQQPVNITNQDYIQPIYNQPSVEEPIPSFEQPQVTNMNSFDTFNFFDKVEQPKPVEPQVAQSVEPKIETPNYNILSNIDMPATAPIIDSTIKADEIQDQFPPLNNYQDEEVEPVQKNIVQEENVQPSIIVTDYSKQYDPVMPQIYEEPKAQANFKDVINIIRECSQKIENLGFKIDVDEYDLFSQYQVVFKIEK